MSNTQTPPGELAPTIPPPEHTGARPAAPHTEPTKVCPTCGAEIREARLAMHAEWHARLTREVARALADDRRSVGR